MMTSALPFDDFRELMQSLPQADEDASSRTRAIFARHETAAGGLGRMEDIAVWLAGWSGQTPPFVNRPLVAIFAGNHGVADHGISPRPVEATARAVELCAAGGAAINPVCLSYDLGLKVFDLALHIPTRDITKDAALDERGCAATMAFGMEAVAGGADLLCLGDIGVGNSTVAATILHMLYGGKSEDWVGRGSGADDAMMRRKVGVVDAAVALHNPARSDPFEILRRVGGREFAAIAGGIIAARAQKIPVLIDGYASISALCILHAVNPEIVAHCLLASRPTDPGLAHAVERLNLKPVLDLGISHDEGVGSALAAGIVKTAALMAAGLSAVPRRIDPETNL